jgi:hypothetical protein
MPATVIDTATGQPTAIPESDVADAWRAGKVDLAGGTKFNVRMPSGKLYTVPAESLHTALGNGAEILSDAQLEQRQADRDYGGVGGALIAGAGGAAEQASLGLAPMLLPESAKQGLAKAEAAHPWMHAAGEVAGAAGLSAVLPGGGLAGLAERGGAAALGEAATSTLGRVAQRAVLGATKGVVEGAQYGASSNIAQSVLDPAQHPLTAESILADVGANALWGGGIGSALGALGGGASELLGRRPSPVVPTAETAPESAAAKEARYYRIQPAGLGVSGHTSGLASEPVNGLFAFEHPEQPQDTYTWIHANKHPEKYEVLELGGRLVDRPLDSEGVVIDPGDILHREPLSSWTPEGARSRLATALGDTRAPSAKDVETVAGKMLGVEPQEGLGAAVKDWYPKIASALSGRSPDDIAAFSGGLFDESSPAYQNRAALLSADEDRAAAAADIRSHLDTLLDANKKLTAADRGGGITLKKSMLGELTADVDPVQAAQTSRALADDTLSRLKTLSSDPDAFGGEKPLASAMKFADLTSKRLDEAIAANDVGAQYAVLDDLKRGIGKYTKGATKLDPRTATDELVAMQGKARAAELQGIYDGLQKGLENQDVWKDAAGAQKAINEAWSKQIDASGRFHSALTTEYARDPENPWVKQRIVDPAKVAGYVNGLADPAKDLTHQSVRDYVQSTAELADSMGKMWELPEKQAAAAAALKQAATDFQAVLGDTAKKVAIVNQFEKFRGQTTGHGLGMLAALSAFGGGHLAGLAGGVGGFAAGRTIGHIASLFTEPAETAMKLARIEGMVRRSDSRIVRGVRGFLRGTTATATALDTGAFARRVAQVKQLATDPSGAQARVQSAAATVSRMHAGLGQALVSTTTVGVAYLSAKVPRELPKDPMDPAAKVPEPPVSERESFMRSYKAVTDPLSVVDDLKAGKLSSEGVDALKTVYPQLYAKVQLAVSDELAGRREPLDYQKQVGLSMLLGLPSPYTSPDYTLQRQAAYVNPAQPSATGPKSGPRKKNARSKPMNLQSQLSPSQRVEQGQAGEGS